MSEADLQATIRGEFTPTHEILVGRAFGKVLEDPDRYLIPGAFQCEGYTFGLDMMEPALALMDRRGVYEAKATKDYGPYTVVSKADQIVGAHLIEHKTTWSTFSFDKYAESYQWRYMVEAFQPLAVSYYVFSLGEERDGSIVLRDINTFRLYPYPELHHDCAALVDRFAEYVTLRGLDGLLRQRQKDAA